jgi:Putative transmembrane protein (PGPGW)
MRNSIFMTAEPERDPKKHRFPFRDEVWGDEPQEVDASELVEELETSRPGLARRWYDHPTIVPFKVVARFIARNGKRVAVTIAGFAVLLAGAAMLVLPGPGIVVILAGLAILGTEYVWAQRLLRIAKEKANQAKDAVFRKKQEETEEGGTQS